MRWFGESWGAPVCDPADHVETPTGTPCTSCTEPIAASDRGLVVPLLGRATEPTLLPYHHMCFLGTVIPLTVHRLIAGLPACGFSHRVPAEWPRWHLWSDRRVQVNCARCRKSYDESIIH